MKYKVVSAGYIVELEEKVNKYLEGGWKPQGSLAYSPVGYRDAFYQTLVKE